MKYFPQNISKIPETTGVYQFFDTNGVIIYIGKAKNLKNRISSYFRNPNILDEKTRVIVPQIHHIEIIILDYEFEALILESNLIRKYKPKYNIIWKDDKHYIYIEVSREEFPRLRLTRKKNIINNNYYGPFPSSKIASDLLLDIRHIFPYCTQNRNQKKECFYTHIGLCSPCPIDIKKEKGEKYEELRKEYKDNISQIRLLLKGNIRPIQKFLTGKMNEYASHLEYEKAKVYRNKLMHLEYLSGKYQRSDNLTFGISELADNRIREMKELINLLKPFFPDIKTLRTIECYDISNISGTLTVGSLVSFTDGVKNPKNYKRFRIKKIYSNDFHAIKEVMDRRLNHTEWIYPDLMVIDGGKQQLQAVQKVLNGRSIQIPFIGLIKKEEQIVVPDKDAFKKITLPRSSSALHLIQRVRDEAHRFAYRYHILLRSKKVFGKG